MLPPPTESDAAVLSPSICQMASLTEEPWTAVCISLTPPGVTLMPCEVMPGVSAAKPCGDRAAGIDSSKSFESSRCDVTF